MQQAKENYDVFERFLPITVDEPNLLAQNQNLQHVNAPEPPFCLWLSLVTHKMWIMQSINNIQFCRKHVQCLVGWSQLSMRVSFLPHYLVELAVVHVRQGGHTL